MAERVLSELTLPASLVSRTEIAGPGFINFWLADDQLVLAHAAILEAGTAYGRTGAVTGVVNIITRSGRGG